MVVARYYVEQRDERFVVVDQCYPYRSLMASRGAFATKAEAFKRLAELAARDLED